MLRVMPLALGILLSPGLLSSAWAQWGWGGGYYSSTAQEGASRGLADLVRAQGQNALLNSAAARNWVEAENREMDNRYKWTETYFQMRSYNRASRNAERLPRMTEEQLLRYAQAGRPAYLSSEQYDRNSGAIKWPSLLTMSQFAEPRKEVEAAFERRAQNDGTFTEHDYFDVQTNINKMLTERDKVITKVTANTYMESRKFLQSLAYDAR